MNVGAIVLARLGSRRLPGKVLMDVGGSTLINRVLDRLRLVGGVGGLTVATSEDDSDQALVDWCERAGVNVGRGPLDDVLRRTLMVAEAAGYDAIARVNADSPWLDPELLDRAVELMRREQVDLVSTIQERTWPYGVAAEIVKVASLSRLWTSDINESLREHVTAGMYADQGSFSIINIPATGAMRRPEVSLTVDDREGLQRSRRLAARLGTGAASASLIEVLETLDQIEGRDHE